jgi:hypothetical protein
MLLQFFSLLLFLALLVAPTSRATSLQGDRAIDTSTARLLFLSIQAPFIFGGAHLSACAWAAAQLCLPEHRAGALEHQVGADTFGGCTLACSLSGFPSRSLQIVLARTLLTRDCMLPYNSGGGPWGVRGEVFGGNEGYTSRHEEPDRVGTQGLTINQPVVIRLVTNSSVCSLPLSIRSHAPYSRILYCLISKAQVAYKIS